jgi:hypothetical protein
MNRIATLLATDGEPTEVVINIGITRQPTLEEQDAIFDGEATAVEAALFRSLPGGLYDRLLGAMLARKSTHFIVRHR